MDGSRLSRRTWFAAASVAGLVVALTGVRTVGAATPTQVGAIPCASQPSVTADFNGDGAKDLVVGAPGDGHEKSEIDGSVTSAKPGAGSINIIYGKRTTSTDPGGLQPANGPVGAPRFLTQDTPGVVEDASAGDGFGSALAAGDFNGDGRPDLAVGIPGEDANAGAVQVFYGGGGATPGIRIGTPGSATYNQLIRIGFQLRGVVVGSNRNAGDLMGWSLAAGDFNNNGVADLAVGLPGYDYAGRDDAGAVLVLFGDSRGLSAIGQRGLVQNGIGDASAERGDLFGASLVAGDFNASTSATSPRADDLVVGAPAEDLGRSADAGAVTAFYGAGGGGAFFTANTRDVPVSPAATSDRFGCSLAAGNFDRDAANDIDLAIGVPGKDIGAATDGGAVVTIYNSNGLTTGAAPEDCSSPIVPPAGSTGVTANNTVGSSSTPRITANDCWIDSQRWTENAGGLPGVAKKGDLFGSSIFGADLNGDGASELIIGAPNETLYAQAAAGSIRVLFGFDKYGLTDHNGMAFAQRPSDPCTADDAENIGICESPPDYTKVGMTIEAGDRFGQTITVGDFNGDGAPDIVVGVPGESVGPAVNYLLEEVVGYPSDNAFPLSIDDEPGAGVVQVIYGARAPNGRTTVAGGERDVLYRQQGGLRALLDPLAALPLGESNGMGITEGYGVGNPAIQAADGGPTTSGTLENDHFGGSVG